MPNKQIIASDSNKMAVIVSSRINEIKDKKAIRNYQKTFHPDELTECGKKLILHTKEAKSLKNCTVAEEVSQDYTKRKWIDLLSKTTDIKILEKFVEVADSNYNIFGNIDCVIEIDGNPIVILIKSLNSHDFSYLLSHGVSRKDLVRVIIDMWLIEIPDAIIIYENRDSLESKIYHVVPYNAIINAIREKTKKLWDCIVKEEIVGRPYQTEFSEECQACNYLKTCWQKG